MPWQACRAPEQIAFHNVEIIKNSVPPRLHDEPADRDIEQPHEEGQRSTEYQQSQVGPDIREGT